MFPIIIFVALKVSVDRIKQGHASAGIERDQEGNYHHCKAHNCTTQKTTRLQRVFVRQLMTEAETIRV